MGVIALLLAVGRKDWIKRAPVLALLGAIGNREPFLEQIAFLKERNIEFGN